MGVCHEDAYNSPCPWPPSQEGSKHSEVTPWAVSCQTGDPSLSLGGAGAGGWRGWRRGHDLRRRATPHSFVSVGVTHSPERRHTPCINQSPPSTSVPSVPACSVSGELVVLHKAETAVWLSRGGDTARKVSNKPGINQERE